VIGVSFTGGPTVTIKSHHNVGGLPERMNMQLVEPLRELFKDECARWAANWACQNLRGPPPVPRPGPGHPHPRRSDRDRCDILRKADAIYLNPQHGLYDAIWQACGAAAGQDRGRDGRFPHLRQRLRAARGDLYRRHDGGHPRSTPPSSAA
jgi:GMP synthase PP-ATPase subunit